jgi:hypothetical protein
VARDAQRHQFFRSFIEKAGVAQVMDDHSRSIPALFAPMVGAAKMVPADLPPMRRTKVNAVIPIIPLTEFHPVNSGV